MHEEHPNFITPPDDVILWRYMDVGRFIALLDSKGLYFARVHELGDPWEAAWPSGLKERAVEMLGASGEIFDYYQMAASQAVVSCWHENERESVAMWRLYTTGLEGVAVKTTIGHLKRALGEEPCSVTIARVLYIDHEADDDGLAPNFNVLGPLFCKRRSFQHEREVRAVIANPDEAKLKKVIAEQQPDLGHTFTVSSSGLDRGLLVPVDMSVLVQSIVVSPQFPSWAIEALQRVIERSGLVVTAESSDLLKRP
jgi:hypothetical protein